MAQPTSSATPLDMDAVMRRIREAVAANSQSPPIKASEAVDGDPLQQLELAVQEQSALSSSVLQSFERLINNLRTLGSDASPAGDASGAVAQPLWLEDEVGRLTREISAVTQSIDAIAARLFAIEPKVDAEVASIRIALDRASAEISTLLARPTGRRAIAAIEGRLASVEEVVQLLQAAVPELQMGFEHRVNNLAERFMHALDALNVRLLRLEHPGQSPTSAASGEPSVGAGRSVMTCNVAAKDFDYFMFEHRWRGTVTDIRQRQSRYVDLFRECKNVLDLGCGRGEFVQLLVENNIPVQGIDDNEDMVRFCQNKSLPVVKADIFEFLTQQGDRTFDAICAFQVVEHLTPEYLVRLIELCASKLQPGGLFLAETINPNCPLALSNFYLDPTHVRPVPAAMLSFMCAQHGYDVELIRYSAPVGGSEAPEMLEVKEAATDVSVYQDYALLARVRRTVMES